MRQGCQQHAEFREPSPYREGAELCNGFVASDEHKGLTTIHDTVDILPEVAGRLSP